MMNRFEQIGPSDGLRHEVVAAGIKTLPAILGTGMGRQRDDGKIATILT